MDSPLNPVAQVDFAFIYIIGISLVILTGIMLVMFYFLYKYDRSRNPIPEQIKGHLGLEVAWMVIPTLIAMSMFYFGWQSYLGLRNVPENALQVDVTARKFAWEFKYPNGVVTEDELVVPVGKPIKVNVTSEDVLHGFFVPAYRIKIDALPKKVTYAWFLPEKEGEFTIYCAEYCGTGHADMSANLRVVSEEEFQEFLAEVLEEEEDDDDDEEEED